MSRARRAEESPAIGVGVELGVRVNGSIACCWVEFVPQIAYENASIDNETLLRMASQIAADTARPFSGCGLAVPLPG